MKNSGQITVFLCLIMSGMLLIATTVIGIINRMSAKEKAVIAAKGVISDVKAEYNTYIFEHYHVLLFDKTSGGLGEADIEHKLEENISEKLGINFNVGQAVVSDYTYIWQDECVELKKQIKDYTKYAIVKNEAEKLMEKIGVGGDTLSDELASEVENQDKEQRKAEEDIKDKKQTEAGSEKNNNQKEEASSEQDERAAYKSGGNTDDPRNFTKSLNASDCLCSYFLRILR